MFGENSADQRKTPLSTTYQTAFSTAVDGLVNTTMLNLKIPSLTVAILHNGMLLHTGAYGLEHIRHDEVPTASTVYLLDSLSKQFTAAGIMLLVQDGKLDLDKPVKTYVPYAPPSWDGITLRHLLTHTAGLPHDPHWGYPPIKRQDSDPDGLLRHHVFNQPLRGRPGQKYAYSNTGYAALGAILSKVSGMPYSRFLAERIFLPLQMTSTRIDLSGARVRHGARGYDYDADRNEWKPDVDTTQPMAAGAIESNVVDLANWDRALNGTSVLTEASKNAMWTSFRLNDGNPSNYGFGWATGAAGGQKLVFHNGGGWGFNCAFYRYLETHLTVIVLTNLQFESKGATHADQLATAIAGLYSPDLSASNGAAASSGVTPSPTTGVVQAGDTGGHGSRSAEPQKTKETPSSTHDNVNLVERFDLESPDQDREMP